MSQKGMPLLVEPGQNVAFHSLSSIFSDVADRARDSADNPEKFRAGGNSRPQSDRGSDFLAFPSAAAEKEYAGDGHGDFSDHNGEECPLRLQVEFDGQYPGQRQFKNPEAEEVH